MNEEFLSKLTHTAADLSPETIVLKLMVPLILGLCLSFIYLYSHRDKKYKPAFVHSMPLIALIVAGITLVIGNSIVRAFGLIGAVSIIRFRSAIKNTRDMAYIFLTITLGMAGGLGLFALAIAVEAVFGVAAITLSFLKLGENGLGKRTYVFRVKTDNITGFEKSIKENFSQYIRRLDFRTANWQGESVELTYRFYLDRNVKITHLLKQLKSLNDGSFENIEVTRA